MLPAALLAALLSWPAPAGAQLTPDVKSPLNARLLVVGDRHLDDAFGRRLKRRLREDLPLWKVSVVYVPRLTTEEVGKLVREDDTVVAIVAGSDFVAVSTAARSVDVGDLSTVDALAELVVRKLGRRCLWIGPPYQEGRAWARYAGAKNLSRRLGEAIRARARGCEYLDSLAYTTGGATVHYEDGLRLRTAPAQAWAEEIASRVARLVR